MKKLFLFFIAAALIAAFSVPAAAADAEWSFYGSARVNTFWVDESKEQDDVHTPPDDDKDLVMGLQGNARIGANVSAGDVSGRFEYGSSDGSANIRLLYGTWNFGGGTLLVGQTYTPVNVFISNQVYGDIGADSDMLSTGGIYNGRHAAIQLQFGDFKIALVENNTALGEDIDTADLADLGAEIDTQIPKIELAYTFKADMFKAGVVAGYQTWEVETDGNDLDIDSWVVGLHGSVNFGPVYIKANVYQAQNGANYGIQGAGDDFFSLDSATEAAIEDETITQAQFNAAKENDNSTLGYLGVVGFKLGDMVTLEGGYGVVEHDSDVTGEKDDETSAYYVQAVIGLAPGVMIIPEYGKIDYDKGPTNAKEGDTTYYGAKWQINF